MAELTLDELAGLHTDDDSDSEIDDDFAFSSGFIDFTAKSTPSSQNFPPKLETEEDISPKSSPLESPIDPPSSTPPFDFDFQVSSPSDEPVLEERNLKSESSNESVESVENRPLLSPEELGMSLPPSTDPEEFGELKWEEFSEEPPDTELSLPSVSLSTPSVLSVSEMHSRLKDLETQHAEKLRFVRARKSQLRQFHEHQLQSMSDHFRIQLEQIGTVFQQQQCQDDIDYSPSLALTPEDSSTGVGFPSASAESNEENQERLRKREERMKRLSVRGGGPFSSRGLRRFRRFIGSSSSSSGAQEDFFRASDPEIGLKVKEVENWTQIEIRLWIANYVGLKRPLVKRLMSFRIESVRDLVRVLRSRDGVREQFLDGLSNRRVRILMVHLYLLRRMRRFSPVFQVIVQKLARRDDFGTLDWRILRRFSRLCASSEMMAKVMIRTCRGGNEFNPIGDCKLVLLNDGLFHHFSIETLALSARLGNSMLSGSMSSDLSRPFVVGLRMGSVVLQWNESGLVVPHVFDFSETEFVEVGWSELLSDSLIRTAADLAVRWNGEKAFCPVSSNSVHFFRAMADAFGMEFEIAENMEEKLLEIQTRGAVDL